MQENITELRSIFAFGSNAWEREKEAMEAVGEYMRDAFQSAAERAFAKIADILTDFRQECRTVLEDE